jgi:hypothetical protein
MKLDGIPETETQIKEKKKQGARGDETKEVDGYCMIKLTVFEILYG